MRFDLIRRPPNDVNVAAVGFPTGNAGSEMLVGVGKAAIMFFPDRVDERFRVGIAALPEDFFILVTLLVGR